MSNKLDANELESLEVSGVGLVKPGLTVEHPTFGIGVVEHIFQFINGGDITIRINFKEFGSKALVPEYANLSLPKLEPKSGSFFSRLFK